MKAILNTLGLLLIVSGSVWGQFQSSVAVSGKHYRDVCIEPLSYGSPQQTDFIVAGNLFDPDLLTEVAFIKKVDENGIVIWNNTYQEYNSPHFRILDILNVDINANENYIFATGYVDIDGERAAILVQFNAVNGNFIQAQSYDVFEDDEFIFNNSTGVQLSYTESDADGDGSPDPGFVIAGYQSPCYNLDETCVVNNGLVIRTDLGLNVLWSVKTVSPNSGGNTDDDFVNNVTETSDGFVITGSGNWQHPVSSNLLQGVLAHKIDFQGNTLWDNSFGFGNSNDVSVDAHYDVATDKIYMLSNYSISHSFGITVFDNNGTYDASRSWYAQDPDYLDTYGFTLMPSLNDPDNLIVSGYDREEYWTDGSNTLYGESNVFVTEFNKNTGNPVLQNYIYTVPNVDPGSEDYSFWNGQMPLMYYPDMSFSKTDNSNNNHYYFAGYRVADASTGEVSLELFKVDTDKENTCDSKPYEPTPFPHIEEDLSITTIPINAEGYILYVFETPMAYTESSCAPPQLPPDVGAFCCDSTNLVTNGNFEDLNNLGFTSSYGQMATPPPGYYDVTNSAGALTAFKANVTDHSFCLSSTLYSANDHFMVVNGKTQKNNNAVIWEQTISGLDTNSTYKFCANFKNMSQCTFDTLVSVKMQVVGQNNNVFNTISSGIGLCAWVNQSFNFNTGTNTSVTLKIILWQKANGDGNDLAIDDISVSKVINPDLNITVQHQGSNQEITASINSIDFNDDALHGTDCEYYWWVGEVPNYPFPTPSPPSLPFGFVSGNASPPHNWNLTTNFTPFYNFNPNTLYFIGMYTPACGCYDEGFTYQLTFNSLVEYEITEEQKQLIIDTILSEASNDLLDVSLPTYNLTE